MRRAVRILLASVAAAGILFLFVLPGRTWLAQDRSISVTERRAQVLAQENARLARRVAQLHSTAYIEQVARQEYGLVMPGEKAYAILPTTSTSTTVVMSHG